MAIPQAPVGSSLNGLRLVTGGGCGNANANGRGYEPPPNDMWDTVVDGNDFIKDLNFKFTFMFTSAKTRAVSVKSCAEIAQINQGK